MSAATNTASRSLYADAWQRLLKNRMAVLCGVIVIVQAFLSAFAFWIAPFPADHQELWIQEQPPGFTHPDVTREMFLKMGSPADLLRRSMHAAENGGIDITVVVTKREEIRVTMGRNGQVRSLLLDGREPLQSLEVGVEGDESGGYLRVVPEDGSAGTTVQRGLLEVRKDPPDWLAPPAGVDGAWVAILERVTPVSTSIVRVEVIDGDVSLLQKDGEDVDKITVRGEEVEKILDAEGDEVTHTHWLGTDAAGGDVWSKVLWGGQVSLLVGLVATIVSLAIGVIYGAASGYFGGRVDAILVAIVDILYGIPYMFLVILLMVVFGRSIIMLFIALGAVQWLTMARIVRGQVLSLKEKEFVEAARTCGAGHDKIIFRHLIPNTLGIVVVYTTLTIPAVILQEAFLAFIGLNVEFDGKAIRSWGALVNDGRLALGEDGQNWWLLVFPASALAIMLFSLNFLGDGLRDAFDPKMKGKQ